MHKFKIVLILVMAVCILTGCRKQNKPDKELIEETGPAVTAATETEEIENITDIEIIIEEDLVIEDDLDRNHNDAIMDKDNEAVNNQEANNKTESETVDDTNNEDWQYDENEFPMIIFETEGN